MTHLDTSSLSRNTESNEFGFKRQEGVFNSVDALNVSTASGSTKTVKLNLPHHITSDDAGMARTLVDNSSGGALLEIPHGSTVDRITISIAKKVDPNLSFAIGYFDRDIKSDTGIMTMLDRVVAHTSPLTGAMLNSTGTYSFVDRLKVANAQALLGVINADLASRNRPQLTLDFSVLGPDDFVGEPRSIYPSITILAGNVKKEDISFTYTFTTKA